MSINFEFLSTPFFIIKINGEKIPNFLTERVMKFEYDEDDEKADMLTLTFNNFNNALIDTGFIQRNAVITVQWGWVGRSITAPKSLIIKDIEGLEDLKVIAFEDGSVTNQIKKQAKQGKFEIRNTLSGTGKEKVYFWEDRYDDVPSSSGSSEKYKIPSDIWTKKSKFSFKYHEDGQGWIKSFRPSIRTQNNPGSESISAQGIDLNEKESFSENLKKIVDEKFPNKIKEPAKYVIDKVTGAVSKVGEVLDDVTNKVLGVSNPSTTGNKESIMNNVGSSGTAASIEITTQADMTMFGNIHVRPKNNIDITGVGRLFNGKWYIKSTTHIIDNNGYETSVSLLRPTNTLGISSGGSSKNASNNSSISGSSSNDSFGSNSTKKETVEPKYKIDKQTGKVTKIQ